MGTRRGVMLGFLLGIVVTLAPALLVAGGGSSAAQGDTVVTVDATSTVSSGGTDDWHGRASIKRRPSDDVLVLTYQQASRHSNNDGALQIRFSDDNGQTWTAANTTLAGDPVSGFPMVPDDAASGEDAGEPWLYVAPNDDLILHMWLVDYGSTAHGTYQSRSTDGGHTWSTPQGPIQFDGLTAAQNDLTFATDDDFLHDGTIYVAARRYTDTSLTTCRVLFIKSDDNGRTWSHVADVTTSQDTQEMGFEYLGNGRIVGVIRSNNNDVTYQANSTDMGETWSVVDVSATVEVSGRHRIYTRAHLQGETGWWKDPVLVMVGFELTNPGSSQGRRNAVWTSPDRGTTWDGPFYIDSATEDAGYGDMFWDPTASQWVVVTYQGTLEAAALKQYRLTVDGI